MQAEYQSKIVYVSLISNDKSYAIVSYSEDKTKQFKVDIRELTNLSQDLQAEINRGL